MDIFFTLIVSPMFKCTTFIIAIYFPRIDGLTMLLYATNMQFTGAQQIIIMIHFNLYNKIPSRTD